jgi:2-polyprenyl-3-methyl-5-hydroxy-6-metoxy-1,4-benzoquinol methylase
VILAKEHGEAAAAAISACPVCASSNATLYLDGPAYALDPYAFGSSRTKLAFGRIWRCADCGFGFSDPRPTDSQLRELYSQMDVAAYESETPGRVRTARRHHKILQRYAKRPGRILDIGCASGRFLAECAAAGWTVAGLEPSQSLVEEARRLLPATAQILPITLQEADFPESAFDAVTMWDVLEHVPDPGEFLRKAVSLLRPGGVLLANVPNLDSWQARVMLKRWPLLLPEHLNYFNRESLARCGAQSGARLIVEGSRAVSFSVGYILHRTAQHIPALRPFGRLASRSAIADWIVPLWIGELYAVWSATPETAGARSS